MHEWLPVSQAGISRGWNLKAEDIWRFSTPTKQTFFYDIVGSNGKLYSGFHHKGRASSFAHKELFKMMQETFSAGGTFDEYRVKLSDWADKHVMLKDSNGNVIATGRDALPDGLRVPQDTGLNSSPRAIYD